MSWIVHVYGYELSAQPPSEMSDTDSSLNTTSRLSTKPLSSVLTKRPVIVAKIGLLERLCSARN